MKKILSTLFLIAAISCFAGLNPVLQNTYTTNNQSSADAHVQTLVSSNAFAATNLTGTLPDARLSGNVLTIAAGQNLLATNLAPVPNASNATAAVTATNAPNGISLNSFSAGLSSLLSEGYQTNVPTSGTTFEAFPKSTLSPNKKTIYRIWGASTGNGVAASSIKFDSSTNGGLSFSTPTVALTNAAYDMRNTAFGCNSQGRLVIVHDMYSLTNAVYGQAVVAVSDDKGVSWTDNYATISTNGMSNYVAPAVMVPNGAITEIDGKLICGFYNFAGTWPIYCLVGTLDASSWTNFFIATGGNFAEPEILPVNSSVWYCVTRRQAWTVGNPCTLWDYWTTNAGTTWSDRPYSTGITTITTNGTYASPVSLNKFETEDGTYISMVFGDRLSGNLYLGVAPFTQVWTNSSMLVSNAIVIGRINTNVVNGLADGGYPSAVIPGRGIEHHVSFYNLPDATTASIKMVKATPKLPHFGKFSGDGSNLTNLNAANLTGVVPMGGLSTDAVVTNAVYFVSADNLRHLMSGMTTNIQVTDGAVLGGSTNTLIFKAGILTGVTSP